MFLNRKSFEEPFFWELHFLMVTSILVVALDLGKEYTENHNRPVGYNKLNKYAMRI